MNYNKLITLGSLVALTGFILSGPAAFTIVYFVRPQPAWVSPAIFAANYSAIQDLPYYFGFLLIGGMMMTVAGHYLNCKTENPRTRFHLLVALGWTVVFSGLIAFNYICQTTFVRHLALQYKPDYDAAIATFSMSNPLSFCWANEMWGYAFLGIATWLLAGYYTGRSPIIRALLVTNGILSLLSAVWTVVDIRWVMTSAGLIGYFAWNLLMITLMMLIYFDSRKQWLTFAVK